MQIERYAERDCERWDDFVRSSRNGTFLFLRPYMDYHADRFEEHSFLFNDKHGRLLALLPATSANGSVVSHGGLTYGGFVVDERMTATLMLQLFALAVGEMRRLGYETLIYKSIPHIYHDSPSEEDLYALFRAGARLVRRDHLAVVDYRASNPRQERRQRAVRKATRSGMAVRETTDFAAFWEILTCTLADRHGVRPVHRIDEIELLRARFPESIRLFGTYDDDRMVAGVVLYVSRHVCHAQYIASSEEGREGGALDLLFDDLIGRFSAVTRYFDFGTSTERNGTFLNSGLAEFKEGFGARTIVHDHYEVDLSVVGAQHFSNVRE